MVAKRTLDGVVEATNETGGNAVETARAVASSAAEAVGGFGTTAVSSVRDILLGVVTGVKDVANAALPRSTGALDELDRTPPPPDRTTRVDGSYPSSGITPLAQALPALASDTPTPCRKATDNSGFYCQAYCVKDGTGPCGPCLREIQ